MKMKTALRAPRRAFTLIEVMIALGILTLVMGSIYSSWVGVIKASKVGLAAAAAAQRERMAMRVVQDALGSAQLYAANIRYYGFTNDSIMGGGGTFSFVARLPKYFPRSGKFGEFDVRRVTFSLEPGPDSKKRLVMRQNPIVMEMDADERKYPVVLAKDVKKFAVEFWDATKNEWTDDWLQTNQLPKAVRVTLQMNTPAARSFSSADVVTRVASLPTAGVQATWQVPSTQSQQSTNRPRP
jgi:prepilin-type N-terminal cleavage/methylation domain-containing protein